MVRVRRADKGVVREIELSFKFAKPLSKGIHIFLHLSPLFLRFFKNLLSVFIGTGIEKNLVAHKTTRPNIRICLHNFKRKADMRIAVYIRKRCCYVHRFSFHTLTGIAERICRFVLMFDVIDELHERRGNRNRKNGAQKTAEFRTNNKG